MTKELKIFEVKLSKFEEREWLACYTNVQAIQMYCEDINNTIWEMDELDEVIEIPKNQWKDFKIEYPGKSFITFEQFMDGVENPCIIRNALYERQT
jgi:hypothetical protein